MSYGKGYAERGCERQPVGRSTTGKLRAKLLDVDVQRVGQPVGRSTTGKLRDGSTKASALRTRGRKAILVE